MTAVHQSASDEHRREGGESGRGHGRSALLAQPPWLVVYVSLIVASYLWVTVWQVAVTGFRLWDVLTCVALALCCAVCVEASRRLGIPAGIARDLLSAWWLPAALLLPPVYALLMPVPLQVLLQYRVRRALLYRRVLVTAALGLAGAAASAVFHRVVPEPLAAGPRWVVEDQRAILAAVGCAVLFIVLNLLIVAVAARGSSPQVRWRDVLWTRESFELDVVELCLGVLITICCVISPALLLLTLPPVVLLQRSLMHQQLQAAARTDAKTGLLNAGAWQREAETELSRSERSHEPLAVLLIDIDYFKRVNDTYGHLTGDQVLVAVAATLCHQLRDYDVIGRFGGEEFAVLLPGADTVEACRVAERLRARVRRLAVPADDNTVSVTISVGVALYRTHGEDLIELLASADLALYRAKESGRDRVCLPAVRKSG